MKIIRPSKILVLISLLVLGFSLSTQAKTMEPGTRVSVFGQEQFAKNEPSLVGGKTVKKNASYKKNVTEKNVKKRYQKSPKKVNIIIDTDPSGVPIPGPG